MIKIEPLTVFEPGLEQLLFPYSAAEYARFGSSTLIAQSECAHVIYLGDKFLCCMGLVRASFTSPPFFWLLLGRGIDRWSARWFRQLARMLRERYPRVQTIIECSYVAGRRFALFCGFAPQGIFIEIDGRKFEFYEVK